VGPLRFKETGCRGFEQQEGVERKARLGGVPMAEQEGGLVLLIIQLYDERSIIYE
jgi:hypothetical protein